MDSKNRELAVVPAQETTATPFRHVSLEEELEREREKNRKLELRLSALRGEYLFPWSPRLGNGCRCCGIKTPEDWADPKDANKIRTESTGPKATFMSAYRPGWVARLFGAKSLPMRMRRDCPLCKAVYYEEPVFLEKMKP